MAFPGSAACRPGPQAGSGRQTLLWSWRSEGAAWRSEGLSEAEDWLGRDASRLWEDPDGGLYRAYAAAKKRRPRPWGKGAAGAAELPARGPSPARLLWGLRGPPAAARSPQSGQPRVRTPMPLAQERKHHLTRSRGGGEGGVLSAVPPELCPSPAPRNRGTGPKFGNRAPQEQLRNLILVPPGRAGPQSSAWCRPGGRGQRLDAESQRGPWNMEAEMGWWVCQLRVAGSPQKLGGWPGTDPPSEPPEETGPAAP